MTQIGEPPTFTELRAALKQYQEQLSEKPSDIRLLTNLAWSLERMGEFGQAIDVFTKALKVNPSATDAQYGLGLALLGSGQIPAALDAFAKARELASRSEDRGYATVVQHHVDVFFRRYGTA